MSFVVTAYCGGSCCNGKWAGQTASGVKPVEGVTCAAGNQYPFGTKIELDGLGTYIVQDRGGAINGNRIDIFMNNHDAANKFGKRTVTGRVIKKS